jgi:hypothetical protein
MARSTRRSASPLATIQFFPLMEKRIGELVREIAAYPNENDSALLTETVLDRLQVGGKLASLYRHAWAFEKLVLDEDWEHRDRSYHPDDTVDEARESSERRFYKSLKGYLIAPQEAVPLSEMENLFNDTVTTYMARILKDITSEYGDLGSSKSYLDRHIQGYLIP